MGQAVGLGCHFAAGVADPMCCHIKAIGARRADPLAALFLGGNQTRVFQHGQMALDRGQGKAAWLCQFGHWLRARAKLRQYGAAGWVGQRVKQAREIGFILSHTAN